ncbi:unnamed protein product [Phytomonas sp. EM1]|nr:unnamed protein product [Phytomonas sp. EM1]|eukprot:CCW64049.1 unnamed protein product [Phytomonas sp. isolate EM1]
MYEEEAKRRRNVELQNQAALAIQRQWRQYLQEREDDHERMKSIVLQMKPTSPELESASTGSAAVSAAGTYSQSTQAALLQEYDDLLSQRTAILERNLVCQHRIACHFAEQRTRKGEDNTNNQLTPPEAERQYWALVRKLHEEKTRLLRKRQAAEEALVHLRERYQGAIDGVLAQEAEFREFIKEISQCASFTHSNHRIPAEDVNSFLEIDEKQRGNIRKARIRYLQLKNEAKRLRHLASQGTGGGSSDGMYLIDLEQLKIENANLNEKIEERNDDIAKLRRKVTTTVHVLTHMREKLEFKREENAELRFQVAAVEEELSGVRDQLAQSKKRRDEFLNSNLRMREKIPLVGSENLLIDYEQRKARINESRIRVVDLTNTHVELVKQIKKYTSEVEQLLRELSHYPTTSATAH